MGQGFATIVDSNTGKSQNVSTPNIGKGDAVQFDILRDSLKGIQKNADDAATSIINTEKAISDLSRSTDPESIKKLAQEQEKLNKIRQEASTIDENLQEKQEDLRKISDKLGSAFDNVRSKFDKVDTINDSLFSLTQQMSELQDAWNKGVDISGVEYQQQMAFLAQEKKAIEQIGDFTGGLRNMESALKDKALNYFKNEIMAAGSAAGLSMKQLAILSVAFDVFIDILEIAYDQIIAANKALVELTRNTGGLFNASMVGADSTGNMVGSMQSLNTSLLMSNLTMDDFSKAIGGLFTDGFGQIAGMKTDLKNANAEMLYFGTQAAKYSKLWGADFTGAVRELTMNYNVGLKESTDASIEVAEAARNAGLNMGAAVKNLEQAAALAGEYYFSSVQNMQNLALYATSLGTDISAMMNSIKGLGSMTDLFQKQQSFAAMELGNTANNLAKIYALKQTGQGDKAASLMVGNLAKDLLSKGMLGTEQGRATLEGAGMDQKTIQAVMRLGEQAKATGMDLQTLTDVKAQTLADKLRIRSAEQSSRTIGESFDMIKGGLMAILIDPLKKVLGPVIKAFVDITTSIVQFIQAVVGFAMSTLAPAFDFVAGIFEGIATTFSTIFGGLALLFESITDFISPVITWLSTVFKDLGNAIGIVIGAFMILFLPAIIASAAATIANTYAIISSTIAKWAEIGAIWTTISARVTEIATIIWSTLVFAAQSIATGFMTIMTSLGAIAMMAFTWPVLLVVIGLVALAAIVWYFWDAVVAIAEVVWDLFMKFNPLVIVINWLIDAVKSLIDWLGWFDEEPEGPQAVKGSTWDEMFGVGGETGGAQNVTQPATNAGVGDYKMAANTIADLPQSRTEIEKAPPTGATPKTGTDSKQVTNVTVNTNVDPMFGSKQSAKSTT